MAKTIDPAMVREVQKGLASMLASPARGSGPMRRPGATTTRPAARPAAKARDTRQIALADGVRMEVSDLDALIKSVVCLSVESLTPATLGKLDGLIKFLVRSRVAEALGARGK